MIPFFSVSKLGSWQKFNENYMQPIYQVILIMDSEPRIFITFCQNLIWVDPRYSESKVTLREKKGLIHFISRSYFSSELLFPAWDPDLLWLVERGLNLESTNNQQERPIVNCDKEIRGLQTCCTSTTKCSEERSSIWFQTWNCQYSLSSASGTRQPAFSRRHRSTQVATHLSALI